MRESHSKKFSKNHHFYLFIYFFFIFLASADKVLNVWNVNKLELETTVPIYEHIRDIRSLNSRCYTSLTGKSLKKDLGGLFFFLL